MEEAREKPKILLLKTPGDASEAPHWARLSKALKTFTDLEERAVAQLAPDELASLAQGFDFTFLDLAAAPWAALGARPVPNLGLVAVEAFAWADWRVREERLEALAAHPLLLLDGLAAPELLRLLHLFLMPKRLSGVTPLMEKGSLILGEKVMEPNAIGLMLDRVATFCDKLDDFELRARLPDLRQALGAILVEGLGAAARNSAVYPFVDFQLAIAPKKLAVNLRFRLGGTPLATVVRHALAGSDIFWQQIWQCSDATVLTHHAIQDELEATLFVFRPERNPQARARMLLHKSTNQAPRREDLLDPPNSYRFLLISEIQAQENSDVQLFTQENPTEGIDELEGLPEAVTSRIRQLSEQCRVLSEHVRRKDDEIKEYLRQNQQITRESNARRAEFLRLTQSREAVSTKADRRIHELESQVTHLKNAATPDKDASSMQEMLTKLESSLRLAEVEKNTLKESLAQEERRAHLLEQKYAQLHKELASRERESVELKTTLTRLRREQADRANKASLPAPDAKDAQQLKIKELEERDVFFKQEVKKLTYKLESQEKNLRAVQTDATEKQRLLDQKLKAAKVKEVELLKRVEELMSSLKKATKVA